MIVLGKGSQRIDGITLFPDHEDPQQFWYLSGPLRLAERDRKAIFSLIVYNRDVKERGAKGGGFATFEVNLRLTDDEQQRVLRKLPAGAKLAPVPFDSGAVKCVALNLGQEQILGAASPSLYGDNTAMFSLALNEMQATILDRAFSEDGMPIGVYYDLSYTAMRPTLDVELKADLSRVYTEVQGQLGFSGMIKVVAIDAKLEAAFQKLVQEGVISMKVVTYTDDADARAQKDAAMRLFMDVLLKEWFTPTFAPPTSVRFSDRDKDDLENTAPDPSKPGGPAKPGAPSGNGAAGGGGEAVGVGAPGGATASTAAAGAPGGATASTAAAGAGGTASTGAAPAESTEDKAKAGLEAADEVLEEAQDVADDIIPTVTLRLRFIRQEELKTVVYRYSGSQTTTRKYYPQGFFSRMLDGVDRASHTILADLDNPFFRTIAITVQAPRLSFERYGLQSVHFAAKYPGREIQSRIFGQGETADEVIEFAVNTDFDTFYERQVRYNFLPDTGWEGERESYELPWEPTEDRSCTLLPHQHLGFLDVEAALEPDFAWYNIREARVRLGYQASSGWRASKMLWFAPGAAAPQRWKLRLSDKQQRSYSYQFEYLLEDGSTVQTAPQTTDATRILVPDQTRGQLRLTFVPTFNRETDRRLFLDVAYADPNNNYSWETRAERQVGDESPIEVSIPVIDLSRRACRYSYTFLHNDGDTSRKSIPEGVHASPIPIRSGGKGELAVTINPDDLDWELLRQVHLMLIYEDPANDYQKRQAITFKSGAEEYEWKIPTLDSSLTSYRWQAIFYARDRSIGEDGAVRTPWETTDSSILFLDRYQPREEKLEVAISGEDLDWARVRQVKVSLSYDDRKNGVRAKEDLSLTEDEQLAEWKVKLADPTLKTYTWRAKFFLKGGSTKSSKAKTDTDSFIDLEQILGALD